MNGRQRIFINLTALFVAGCSFDMEGSTYIPAYLPDTLDTSSFEYGGNYGHSENHILPSIPLYFCNDSDGDSYYTKGRTWGTNKDKKFDWEDLCLIQKVLPENTLGQKKFKFIYIPSCNGDDCRIIDFSCDQNNYFGVILKCPGGCNDGKCLPYHQKEPCLSTKDGINVKRNGQTIGLVDLCFEDPLVNDKLYATKFPALIKRNLCVDGQEYYIFENCDSGCEDISCKF